MRVVLGAVVHTCDDIGLRSLSIPAEVNVNINLYWGSHHSVVGINPYSTKDGALGFPDSMSQNCRYMQLV